MTATSKRKEAVFLKDYKPTDYTIDETHLTFELSANATKVVATLNLAPRAQSDEVIPLVLDGDALNLKRLKLNGKALEDEEYEVTPDLLIVHSPPKKPFTLEIETEIDPADNKLLMGLFRTGAAYCTQCEAEGFRRITYFYDRPDLLSTYTVRVEADKKDAPILLSNGNKTKEGKLKSGRHFAVWHDPFPKPSYLFALVAGDLAVVEDSFKTRSGRDVKLQIFVEHGKQTQCDYAMDALKRSMKWDEDRFDMEYDLDIFMIVAVSDFNMGAMENKGLNIFNDKYILADPETATDQDYAGIERVVAHEYFHNWTGNRITCRDWFQLCVKEGLTVYRDQQFCEDMRSEAVQRIAEVKVLQQAQFPEDQGPLAHPVRPDTYEEIDNFYTATVYRKGAELVRMVATLVGQDGFKKGMELYVKRHDGEATTVEQFLKCFEDANTADLEQFASWYSQPGTPIVKVVEEMIGESQRKLTISQRYSTLPHIKDKQPDLHIPLKFGFVGDNGEDVDVTSEGNETNLIELKENSQVHVFENIPKDARLSINRNFSAPILLEQNSTESDEIFLAGNDPDPFNRWQAIQNLAMKALVSVYNALVLEQKPASPAQLAKACKTMLANDELDDSFKALCLQLPSCRDMAVALKDDVHPNLITSARQYVTAYLSLALDDELQEIYASYGRSNDTSTGSADAGRRALKNTALHLLVSTDEDTTAELAKNQTMDATNMTDRVGAISALCAAGRVERAEPLAAMYAKFSDNGLVMDKWLMLQAGTESDNTLANVRSLLHDPVFSLENPNRVRSLLGAFAGNFSQFHRLDGTGYQFFLKQVAVIDKYNGQLAARLLESLSNWRMLEPGRQRLVKLAFDKLRSEQELSSNTAEILDRMTST